MNKQIVMVPTDFSELSNVAVDYAFSMVKRLGGKMIFLHSVDWSKYEMTALSNEVYDFAKKEASKLLDDLVERAKRLGIEAEGKWVEGPPFVEIIHMAKKMNADLIIMGTHGRTGLSNIVIGSQAERVVRQAPCPVLTVKSPTHVFVPV